MAVSCAVLSTDPVIDFSGETPGEGGAELSVQLVGDRLGCGPRQDLQPQIVAGDKRRVGGVDVVGMAGYAFLVEDDRQVRGVLVNSGSYEIRQFADRDF